VEALGSGRKAAETLKALQHNITSGVWPVNSRIPKEAELMEMLGVGKSTVREAVRSLASMGILEPIKGVGTFVRSRTPVSSVVSYYVGAHQLDDVLGCRRALEIEAARQAAVNRSEEQLAQLRRAHEFDLSGGGELAASVEFGEVPGTFHHLVFEAAGNALMSNLYSALMAVVRGAVGEGTLAHRADDELRHRDHAAILSAIEAQDVARAAEAMALHTDRDLVPGDGDLAGELRDPSQVLRIGGASGGYPGE
jgi:DNA-binding FadR family transcriptional regulator